MPAMEEMRVAVVGLWALACAWQDFRTHRVSNLLTLPAFFVAWALGTYELVTTGNPSFYLTLVVVLVAWQLKWLGGADGKMTAAMAVFAPAGMALGFGAMAVWFGARRLMGKAQIRLPLAVGFAVGMLMEAVLVYGFKVSMPYA